MINIQSFVFSPIGENTYVLYNEQKECCIIDPGCYFDKERLELQKFIADNSLQPKFLLNTHCHLDHVFGNKFIYETYGLRLCIHEKEKLVLDYAPTAGLRWGMPFENYSGPLKYLQEGEVIALGNDELKVLFAPGHSPGHICFYCEKQQFIISGDVLFKQSIGRTDLPGGDFDTLIKSIKEQLYVLPDEVKVYSGHGEPTRIGDEKKHNPFVR